MTLAADDMLSRAAAWTSEGRRVALATVVETWGSSPRPVGSQMVIDAEGRFEGSVSGGCIEGTVVEIAGGVIGSRAPRIVEFGISDDEAWAVGLACGGRVKVFVEPIDGADA